jgi:hypothetical protein
MYAICDAACESKTAVVDYHCMFQIARNEMMDMQRQDKFTLLLIQRTLHKLTVCCAAGKVL